VLASLIKDHGTIVYLNSETRDKEGNTPSMVAGKNEFVEGIELLMYRGADTNAKNTRGHTALHVVKASSPYRTQAVRRLSTTKALWIMSWKGQVGLVFLHRVSRLPIADSLAT
jgi:hypothetical protein